MYCAEGPLSCKYFTKIRKRKALPEPHLCFWTCMRASHRAEWSLCSPTEKCWVVTPAWGSPAPAETLCSDVLSSVHPCVPQTGVGEHFLALGGFSSLNPLLTCSHWLWWICVGHTQWTLQCWSPLEAALMAGVDIIHYWEGPFSFRQAEKSWGGISSPTAELQRPEKHSKALSGNREYPLQCVCGVQSRLRKERLKFQRQGRPWLCWCVLLSGNTAQQEW